MRFSSSRKRAWTTPTFQQNQPEADITDICRLRVALENGGIVQLPKLVVYKDIRNGVPQPVLDDWRPKCGIIHALFPTRSGMPHSVRTLLNFLGNSFEALDFENLYEGYVLRGDEDACFLTDSRF